MSAKFTIAIHRDTRLPIHVTQAKKGLACNCVCDDCDGILQAVQGNLPKESQYFRHDDEKSKCPGSNETALHKYAKLVLYESQFINSKKKKIDYSDALLECVIDKIRSDVKVKYLENDLHFEVVVSHNLSEEKISQYRKNRINCIKIDLSHPALRSSLPEQIKYAVLHNNDNKDFIQWNETQKPVLQAAEPQINFGKVAAFIALGIAAIAFLPKLLATIVKAKHRR